MVQEASPENRSEANHTAVQPVAIGGLGGSGTRLLAQMLRDLDFNIGDDLNEALDNLWFTLLFKHEGIREVGDLELHSRFRLFRNRMRGGQTGSCLSVAASRGLIATDRGGQHAPDWLEQRLASLTAQGRSPAQARWGWKEPNTHMVIDRLLGFDPALRYIHLWRDPLYMSCSRNQNQLRLWGPAILGSRYEMTARGSLAFWVWAHSRILDLQRKFPGRIVLISYDELCSSPGDLVATLMGFLRVKTDAVLAGRLAARVQSNPRLVGKSPELDGYDESDLEFLRLQGML